MAFDAGSIDATLTLNRNPFTAGMAAARNEARSMENQKINVAIVAKLDRSSLNEAKTALKAWAASVTEQITLNVRLNNASLTAAKQAIRGLGADVPVSLTLDRGSLTKFTTEVKTAVGRINASLSVSLERTSLATTKASLAAWAKTASVNVSVKAMLESGSMTRIREQLNTISSTARAKVDVDRTAFDKLLLDLQRFGASSFTAKARVDTSGASADLNALNRDLDNASNRTRNLNDTTRDFNNAASSGFGGGQSHFAKMAVAIIAGSPVIASGLSAIIGVVGALAGALGVAGAGAAAFALVAVSTFKDIANHAADSQKAQLASASAARAMEAAQSNLAQATQNASRTEVAARQSVADAERGLATAIADGADARAAASDRVTSAEQSLQRAQEQAQTAQENLTQARKDAKETLENLQLALRGGALSEEQAILNLEKAQLRFNDALKKGVSGNELKQLELDTRQAGLAVDVAKEHYIDLQQETAGWAKTGIDGSQGVVDAQRGVRDATRNVSDAEKAVGQARKDATKVAEDSKQTVLAAERTLAQAREDYKRAVIDGQRAIADAQRQVAAASAQAAAAQLLAVAALTPAMKLAEDALNRLKAAYKELKLQTQDGIALAFVANFDAAIAGLRTLAPLINATSVGFEKIGRLMEAYFKSPEWQGFVDFVTGKVGPTLESLFLILAYGTQGIFNLIKAFAPLTDWMLPLLVQGMKDFAGWTERLGTNTAFQAFLEGAKRSIPVVGSFLLNLLETLMKVIIGLEPLGTMILKVLNMIFEGLNKLPPEWIAAIALSIGALWAAVALGATGPVGLAIGVLAGMAVLFADLYNKNESFRKSIDDGVNGLKANFLPIWNTIQENFRTKIIPAWERLVQVYKDELQPVVEKLAVMFNERIWPVLSKIADTITGKLVPAFLDFMTAIAPFVSFITETLGVIAIDAIEKLGLVFDNILQDISSALRFWKDVFNGDWKAAWEEIKISFGLKKDLIEILFGDMWKDFHTTMKEEGELLKTEWNTMWGDLKTTLKEEGDIWHELWVNFWGGIKTTQSGEIVVVESEWSLFLKGIGNTLSEEATIWGNNWTLFWSGWGGTQDDGQGKSTEGYGKFWNDLGLKFHEWWGRTSKEWTDFWAGFKAKADEIEAQIWGSWNKFWNDLGLKFSEWWNRTVTEWNNFWAGFAAKANEIEAKMWGDWNKFWADLGTTFANWWNRTVKEWNDFWAGIGATLGRWITDIQTRWNNFWGEVDRVRREVWAAIENGIRTALANIRNNVDQAATDIGIAFRKIANFFRDPIDWVIRVVLNDGVLKAWNTVMGWIGQPGLNVAPIAPLPVFAAGGPITGGQQGKDSVPILTMPGEYVLSKRAVDNLGGIQSVDELHKSARGQAGGTGGRPKEVDSTGLMGFQAGGAIYQQLYNAVKQALPLTKLTSGYRAGDPGYHGKGMAADLAGPAPMDMPYMLKINKWISSNYGPGALELIHTQLGATNLWHGAPHTYDAQTRADHVNHVHWAANGLSGAGSAGGGLDPIQVDLWSLFGGAASGLMNKLTDVAGIPGRGSPVGDAAGRIPSALIPKVIDALKKKLEKIFTTVAGTASPNQGSMAIQGIVDGVAKGYGWGIGSDQWTPLSLLIGKESSWNPNAQNPTSTAYGLFQFLNSTWATVGASKTPDPRLQTIAGLKYIQQRYTNPRNALDFHNRNNWYDNGGWLQPGKTMAWNATGRPEKVVSHKEYREMSTAGVSPEEIAAIVRTVMAETAPSGDTFNVYGQSGATVRELANEIDFKKRVTAKGRYSR